MVPPVKFIWTVLAEKIDGNNIEGQKIRSENPHKFIRKLNKQQTGRWRHLSNLAELFLWKDLWLRQFLMGTMLTKLGQIATKNALKFVH